MLASWEAQRLAWVIHGEREDFRVFGYIANTSEHNLLPLFRVEEDIRFELRSGRYSERPN